MSILDIINEAIEEAFQMVYKKAVEENPYRLDGAILTSHRQFMRHHSIYFIMVF